MNLLAFVVVLAALVLGIVILFQTGIKNLIGWAIVLVSAGVIIQEVLTKWSHGVHA
jgi:hypothetical protein